MEKNYLLIHLIGEIKQKALVDLNVKNVIVDPPRVGLDKGVPEMIASWSPERIIYVSCNSVTAARDIPLFDGYRIEKAKVFDFYPGSSHEEVAVVLVKN